jgi:tight adherence protein B
MSSDPVILELAGLLKAGIPANNARAGLNERLARLPAGRKSQFEMIWSLANKNGGAIGDVMTDLSDSFKSADRHRNEIELAFAGPKATARVVSLLPIACLLLAQVFGLNPLGAIFTKPLAFISVVLGIILLAVGRIWTRSMLEKANFDEKDPGLIIDAVRFGLSSGLPFSKSLSQAVEVLGEFDPLDEQALGRLTELAEMNRDRGASLGALLESEAQIKRESQRNRESTAVAQLSVRLMLPLGLLTLPAFILCAVAPITIGLLSANK